MGIALLAASTLAHPLTALHRWWSRQRAPMLQRGTPHAAPLGLTSTKRITRATGGQPLPGSVPHPCTAPGGIHLARASDTACRPATRPLRAATPSSGAIRVLRSHGRMVIAGRMADVCAELERLAACEPQH